MIRSRTWHEAKRYLELLDQEQFPEPMRSTLDGKEFLDLGGGEEQ
jgi:hypothetical protein